MSFDPDKYPKTAKMQALIKSYQSAVVNAARAAGFPRASFGDALLLLPPDTVRSLHASFRKQAEKINSEEA